MVRSHTVMVWNVYLTKKSLLVVCGWWQTKFSVSQVLGPFAPDLGPDLDLTWDLDLDLSLTMNDNINFQAIPMIMTACTSMELDRKHMSSTFN